MPRAAVEPKPPVDLGTGRMAKGNPLVVVHHRVKDAAAPHRPHLPVLLRAELTIRAGGPAVRKPTTASQPGNSRSAG